MTIAPWQRRSCRWALGVGFGLAVALGDVGFGVSVRLTTKTDSSANVTGRRSPARKHLGDVAHLDA